jgi:hypothetical protein
MAPAALLIAGGGMMAAGAIQEGRIARAQGRFEQQIALRNQQALERQAKAEMEAAGIEEARVARQEKIAKARQRAVIGKSGIGLAGATLSVLTDTAFQFAMERNLILRRGMVRARELRERGQITAAQGRWAKRMGTQAERLSYFRAGGSILGSIGTAGLLKPGSTYMGSSVGSKAGLFGTRPGGLGSVGAGVRSGGLFINPLPGIIG